MSVIERPPTLPAAAPRMLSDPRAEALGLVGETTFEVFASWCLRNCPGPASEELQHFVALARKNKASVERWGLGDDEGSSIELSWGKGQDELSVTFDRTGEPKWRDRGKARKVPPGHLPDGAVLRMRGEK